MNWLSYPWSDGTCPECKGDTISYATTGFADDGSVEVTEGRLCKSPDCDFQEEGR